MTRGVGTHRHRTGALVATIALVVASCGSGATSAPTTQPLSPPATADGVAHLRPEVVAEHPHDTSAYTQGLLVHKGRFYESAGRYGESSLREVDIATGEVLRREDLPDELFAEGLALVDDRLIQLTWREGVALVWDAATFELLDEWAYDGEGWGLCFDGERLVMSDGSSVLAFRDPDTFEVLEQVPATVEGRHVSGLNELACVDGEVWANVYPTDEIVVIEAATGTVRAVVDGSSLGPQPRRSGEVLNGIAHDDGTWYLTGKRWPTVYEVRFVEAEA